MAFHAVAFYLPEKLKGRFLFGYKKIEVKEKSSVYKYFVISSSNNCDDKHGNLEYLGTSESEAAVKSRVRSKNCENDNKSEFNLITDESNEVIKVKLNTKELANHQISLFYYNKEKFKNTYSEFHQPNVNKSFALLIAKALKDEHALEAGESKIDRFLKSSRNILLSITALTSKVFGIFSPVFHNTAIYRHCSNWRKCLNDGHSRNGFVMLDVMLGILFFLFMNHIQDSGRHFMDITEVIVGKLRVLLEMLHGSPVGLKLNVQLNNFLLSCFMYHVDLWFNFIVIVEPAIHYLFLPITIFGFFGLSFQCALLCDIITLITLHAHCFYIYAAMLYKLELSSIRSLLRIVLGRRLNVLKSKLNLNCFLM